MTVVLAATSKSEARLAPRPQPNDEEVRGFLEEPNNLPSPLSALRHEPVVGCKLSRRIFYCFRAEPDQKTDSSPHLRSRNTADLDWNHPQGAEL
jgi:hypothetical protein